VFAVIWAMHDEKDFFWGLVKILNPIKMQRFDMLRAVR
jgi:hypothetical protein